MNRDIIKTQVLAIRDSGVTNMFDIPRVTLEAEERGFVELVSYLKQHKKDYWNFILTGEIE